MCVAEEEISEEIEKWKSTKVDAICTDNGPTLTGDQNIEIKHEYVDEIGTESEFSDSQNFYASIENEDYEFVEDEIVFGPICFDGEPVSTFTDDQDFEIKNELIDEEVCAGSVHSDTHTHTSHMSTFENEPEHANKLSNEGEKDLDIIKILFISSYGR